MEKKKKIMYQVLLFTNTTYIVSPPLYPMSLPPFFDSSSPLSLFWLSVFYQICTLSLNSPYKKYTDWFYR